MSAAARPWVRVITMERPDCLAQALESLRTLHIDRVSCIGGRTLATALLDLGLIDDVDLTTAPGTAGEPGTPTNRGQLQDRSSSGSMARRRIRGALRAYPSSCYAGRSRSGLEAIPELARTSGGERACKGVRGTKSP